jgi:uncharacterized cupredoxin-like copper-binding protein
MVRPLPAPGRRRTAAGALALLVLGVSGCGVAVSDPGLPLVRGAGGGSGTGMMGGAAAGTVPGDGSRMSGRLTCAAPSSLPGSTVSVVLADMGMMGAAADPAPLGVPMRLRASTTSVPAGRVSLVAQNLGRRTHELVVLPLAAGQAPGSRTPGSDGKVAETGRLGEVSRPCAAGSGDGLTAGTSGWVTLTLAPGRYELVCNEANHYADGMWAEFDVT